MSSGGDTAPKSSVQVDLWELEESDEEGQYERPLISRQVPFGRWRSTGKMSA